MNTFSLNEKEEKTLEDLLKSLDDVYGKLEDRKISYIFTPTGIGVNITVKLKTSKYNIKKDITDYDSW